MTQPWVRVLGSAVTLAALPITAPCADSGAPLAQYQVVGDGIPVPLTNTAGDPARGRATVMNSKRGNCLVCHRMPLPEVAAFGDVGPPLDGVATRLSESQLRLRLVDSKRLYPDSLMPSYHKVEGLHRVAPRYRGQPVLTAQEVEDVLAFLLTLR